MALTITGRLYCAARHAYEIRVTGTTPASPSAPAPGPSTLVGYLEDPACFVAGLDGIDAVLFGETPTEFILAFRGTEPPASPDHQQMICDWANDLDAVLTASPNDLPGLVHPGFLRSLNDLWPLVFPAVQAAVAAKPTKPLYITGHSKGGGLAPMAAMRCVAAGMKPYVCTFAAAKCGDQDFATAYNQQVPHSIRYEFQDDVIPHLPPSDTFIELFKKVPWFSDTVGTLARGYVAVGTLNFINWQNQIVGDSPTLYFQRAAHLGELMLTFGYATIMRDHSDDPGFGYATSACPGVWPANG